MKNLLLGGLVCMLSTVAMAETLSLTINGVDAEKGSEKGQIVVQVYNSKKTWMEEDEKDMVLRKAVPIAHFTESDTVELELDHGEYAIQLYHDLDGNDEMKTNWIGIPREPVGTSNNAKGKMGPPKYKDAKFVFDGENAAHTLDIVNID